MYQPGIPPAETKDLKKYVFDELRRIADALRMIFNGYLHPPYGSMYMDDGTQTVTISVADTYYEIGGGMSDGGSVGFIFQNSKELKCLVPGKYLATWSISVKNNNSDRDVSGGVMVNSTEQHQTENGTRTKEDDVEYSIGGTGIVDLVEDDLVKLMVEDYDGTGTLTISHANLTLVLVGWKL